MDFRFEQTLDVPRDRLFGFFEDPANLALLMRRWPGFCLLGHDGCVRVGRVTRFEARWGPLQVVMFFRNIAYEPPRRFVDELAHGPFRRFRHTHLFLARGESTVVRDDLDVELPWQFGGSFVTRRFVAAHLRRLFAYRHRELSRLLCRPQPISS